MLRLTATLVAGALATVALAACSSSSKSGAGTVGHTAPGSTTAASTAQSTSSASSAAASGGGANGLTPTGTTFAVGATAKISYELESLSHDTTTLAMTVKSVKQGAGIDLKDFKLDAQSKVGVPFYVTASFQNVGDKTLKPSGIFGTIDALNASGDKVTSITLLGTFPKCEGLPPDSLGPGKSFTQCEVYIAPAGQVVKSIVYDHFVGLDETKITWKV